MQFDMGFAYRGSSEPEVRQVVEAGSMREAIGKIVDQFGGKESVLVTHAQYFQAPDPLRE